MTPELFSQNDFAHLPTPKRNKKVIAFTQTYRKASQLYLVFTLWTDFTYIQVIKS